MNREEVIDSVNSHGEVHVVVEEHESVLADSDENYIGLRMGNSYDYGSNCVTITEGSTVHKIPYERIVYLQKPTQFPD